MGRGKKHKRGKRPDGGGHTTTNAATSNDDPDRPLQHDSGGPAGGPSAGSGAGGGGAPNDRDAGRSPSPSGGPEMDASVDEDVSRSVDVGGPLEELSKVLGVEGGEEEAPDDGETSLELPIQHQQQGAEQGADADADAGVVATEDSVGAGGEGPSGGDVGVGGVGSGEESGDVAVATAVAGRGSYKTTSGGTSMSQTGAVGADGSESGEKDRVGVAQTASQSVKPPRPPAAMRSAERAAAAEASRGAAAREAAEGGGDDLAARVRAQLAAANSVLATSSDTPTALKKRLDRVEEERDDLLVAKADLVSTVGVLRQEMSRMRESALAQEEHIAELLEQIAVGRSNSDGGTAGPAESHSRQSDSPLGDSYRLPPDRYDGDSAEPAVAELETDVRQRDKTLALKAREIEILIGEKKEAERKLGSARKLGGSLTAQVAKLQDWRTRLERDLSSARNKITQLSDAAAEGRKAREQLDQTTEALEFERERNAKLQLRFSAMQRDHASLKAAQKFLSVLHGPDSPTRKARVAGDSPDKYTPADVRLQPGASSRRRGTYFGSFAPATPASSADERPPSEPGTPALEDDGNSSARSATPQAPAADVFHSPIAAVAAGADAAGPTSGRRHKHHRRGHKRGKGHGASVEELGEQILLRVHAERRRDEAERHSQRAQDALRILRRELDDKETAFQGLKDRFETERQRAETLERVAKRAQHKMGAVQQQRDRILADLNRERDAHKELDAAKAELDKTQGQIDVLKEQLKSARSRNAVLHLRERKAKESTKEKASPAASGIARHSGARSRRTRSVSPTRSGSAPDSVSPRRAEALARARRSRTSPSPSGKRLQKGSTSARRGTYFGLYPPGHPAEGTTPALHSKTAPVPRTSSRPTKRHGSRARSSSGPRRRSSSPRPRDGSAAMIAVANGHIAPIPE